MKTLQTLRNILIFWSVLALSPVVADDAPVTSCIPEPPGCQKPDIWLISTRHLSCPRATCEPSRDLRFYRLEGGQWQPSSAQDFYGTSDPAQITCFYIHGNRIRKDEVFQRGMRVYQRLNRPANTRFVIWSWPSTPIRGRIRDARTKAARADGESFYLAHTMGGMSDSSTVSLIGYSFGARIVTGTLHLLGGGALKGNVLSEERRPEFRPRAVLLAPAVSRGWLRPEGIHGMATYAVDQIYSTYNTKDPALKHFYVTNKQTKPTALGFSGISSKSLGPNRDVMHQQNITQWVGWNHTFDRHLDANPLMATVRRYALWDPTP